MKKLLSTFVVLLTLCFSTAHADVLTFDDVDLADGSAGFAQYGGFDVSSFGLIDQDALPGTGYANGVFSPENVAFNGGAQSMTMSLTNGSPFDVDGAYFTGAWRNNLSILATGIDGNGNILDSLLFNVDSFSPTWINLDFEAVDTVVFSSFGGTDAGYGGGPSDFHFAMDNFTFTAVPEPGSACLIGLVALGAIARRRK